MGSEQMNTELPTCGNKHTAWGNRSMCRMGMAGNSVSPLEDLASVVHWLMLMKQTIFSSLPSNSGPSSVSVHAKSVCVKRTFFSAFFHLFPSVDKSGRW